MKNPLEIIDDTVMVGVNKTVQAYNWTTGGTKADLANNLMIPAELSYIVGYFNFNPYFGSLAALVGLPALYLLFKKNKEIEDIEKKANEGGLKNIKVENYKANNKISGYLHMAFSGICTPIAINSSSLTTSDYLAFGSALSSLSFHVMRADNLPPRKNVFSRAKDKLKEKLSDPTFQPVNLQPIPMNNNYTTNTLEEII